MKKIFISLLIALSLVSQSHGARRPYRARRHRKRKSYTKLHQYRLANLEDHFVYMDKDGTIRLFNGRKPERPYLLAHSEDHFVYYTKGSTLGVYCDRPGQGV